MIKYIDIKNQAKERYPDDIWKQVSFVNGALWFMRQVCPEKEKDMEIIYTTLD